LRKDEETMFVLEQWFTIPRARLMDPEVCQNDV
jgi:hypothetical protein